MIDVSEDGIERAILEHQVHDMFDGAFSKHWPEQQLQKCKMHVEKECAGNLSSSTRVHMR
jgi:hypothetical protein